MNLQNVNFIKSAADPAGFLSNSLPKIVFSGKSNVGKSSVINRALNRKNFARVGETPGKTAHVNYFLIDERVYFVDLPGYGYARVSDAEIRRWGRLMEAFFERPDDISLGVLIVDARHAPTEKDVTMAGLYKRTRRPFIVLANKTDKVKKSALEDSVTVIRAKLELEETTKILPFSAETGAGREALLGEINRCV
jgi:GTP-binding protein